MYKDGAEYYGTHYWWDYLDREHTIVARWKFEKGGDIPDSWYLEDWEVESVEPQNSPFSYVYDPKVIEDYIYKDGPPEGLIEVDHV